MTTIAPTPPFHRPVPSPGFVLGVDVAAAWLLSQLGNLYTSEVLTRVGAGGAIVPGCWPLQLAETSRAAERRGQKSAPEVDSFLALVSNFLIRVDDETSTHAWADTLRLVRTRSASAFDAAYLELASRLRLPLATTDARLVRAAAAAGVPIFTP